MNNYQYWLSLLGSSRCSSMDESILVFERMKPRPSKWLSESISCEETGQNHEWNKKQ